ncbi:MAG: hypothetical protein ACK5V3_09615 [Bdellovibrionales bacterium]
MKLISIAYLIILFSISSFSQVPTIDQLASIDKSLAISNVEQRKSIIPFACIGTESGAIVARATYQCFSARGQFFTLSIYGVELELLLAANLSFGYATKKIEKGTYELNFKLGAYKGLGGSVINAGPLRLLGVGLGYGGGVSYGVPVDSLFGGQLVIE